MKPRVILTLGATAALGVLDRKVAVTRERGVAIPQSDGARVVMTVHPSYLLRLPDEEARVAERRRFIDDLKFARAML